MANHRNNVERRLAFLEKAYLKSEQRCAKYDALFARNDERWAKNDERLAKLMQRLLNHEKEQQEQRAAIRTIAHTFRRHLEGRGNGGGRER